MTTRWSNSLPADSPHKATVIAAHQTFARCCKRADTDNLLRGHRLADPALLQLAGQPENLTAALYRHPSIVERFYDADGEYPG